MEIEERQGSTCHKPAYSVYNQMHEDLKAASISLSQTKQIDSSGEEHAPRIRKPYTITKQRERWTEEEHNKFVQALLQYGRSWRQIEEHIGTKTAVQIRSHAQKFFSKVVREAGSNDNASTLKAIEIPPPRPKKKPVHPYPRKCGNLSNSATPPVLKPFQRPLHIPAICEIENRSPISVLSAVGSENLDSTFSNGQMGCTSPVSSAAGSNDQEDGGQFTIAVQEENKVPLFGPVVPKLTMQDHPQMEMNRCPDVLHTSSEAQAPTLKLFGKMVVVMDSNKPSTPSAGNVSQSNLALCTDLQGNQGNKDFGLHSKAEHLQIAKQASSPEEFSRSPWNAGPALVPPLFYCFPLVRENSTMEPASFVHHPWWGAMYSNLPFSFVHPEHLVQSAMQAGGEQEMQREGSWAGSNTESVSGAGLCNQNVDGVDSKKVEISEEHGAWPCSGLKWSDAPSSTSGTVGSGNVFVPYKRCAVESEEQHSVTPSDDSESQAIRLCL